MSDDAKEIGGIVKPSSKPLLSVDEEYLKLETSLKQYMDASSLELCHKAFEFARKAHQGQMRKSGDEYITHPVAVAKILADMHLDRDSILAAILHDTVEDTPVSLDQIKDLFGQSVATLVDGLTKISRVKFRSNQEKLAENFRKMIVAMAKDLRVILVKLADRLHNMRTLGYMNSVKARRIADETLEIYAPLANRLGIYGVKSELEDLCLRQIRYDVYQEIRAKIAAKKGEREAYIREVKEILEKELKKYNFKNFEVSGRPKHFYSIYKKMMERKVEFEDINDLFAFRVVVDSIRDCYEVLGIVHAMWKPMPGRFKDYIAMPKGNMYQSLHTTVIRPNGEPAEIQIRTREMQTVCENGVAAHWAYKERDKPELNAKDLEKFSWLRQIVQWQNELHDPDEFLEAVKVDLFDEEIFVFTPKGDVFSLPKGATTLDFAFAVHTHVGEHTVGAKINARIVPLKKELQNGDIVEILTSKTQRPNKDWLGFVKTSKARNKIRSSMRKEGRDESRLIGEEMLKVEFQKEHINIENLSKKQIEFITKYAKESSMEDVFVAIGYGKVKPTDILAKLPREVENVITVSSDLSSQEGAHAYPERSSEKKSTSGTGIIVSGIDNVLVYSARCCNPLPGEDIVGFITRGKGISIHRTSCGRALDLDPVRKVEAHWEQSTKNASHRCYLRVFSKNRLGVLAEVTQAMMSCGVNVTKADIRVNKNHVGVLDFEVTLKDMLQLDTLRLKLESIPSVISVERRMNVR